MAADDRPAATQNTSGSNASQGARANQIEAGELETSGNRPAWIGRPPRDRRERVKGSRKHCSTHDEYRSDCYRCNTEGTFL